MKKIRYFIVILIFLVIVPISLYAYLCLRPLFPHYKQVFIQHNECVLRNKNTPVMLNFVIFDEKDNSEMEHKHKIKKIDLIDSKGGAITLSKWSIFPVSQNVNYITRNLQTEISLSKEGVYDFRALSFIYADDSRENHNIGSIKVDIKSKEYIQESMVNHVYAAHLINAKSPSPYVISGFITELDFKESKNIVTNNIDLGIKGFEVDYNNIHFEYSTVTTQDILKMRESSPPAWLKPFDSINMDANQASAAPIPLTLANNYPNDSKEKRVTLFIPLICTDTEYLKTINVFCVTLESEIDGEEKIIHVGNNWPLTCLPAEGLNIDPVKLLKEQGK